MCASWRPLLAIMSLSCARRQWARPRERCVDKRCCGVPDLAPKRVSQEQPQIAAASHPSSTAHRFNHTSRSPKRTCKRGSRAVARVHRDGAGAHAARAPPRGVTASAVAVAARATRARLRVRVLRRGLLRQLVRPIHLFLIIVCMRRQCAARPRVSRGNAVVTRRRRVVTATHVPSHAQQHHVSPAPPFARCVAPQRAPPSGGP